APGSAPGTLNIAEDAYPTHITFMNYNSQHFQRAVGVAPQECFACTQDPTTVSWIDVQGLGTESVLREMADWVNLPPLLLEDIVNVPQRPKIEYYGEFLLIVSQMVMVRPQGGFWNEQISFILGKNFVLTFQEEPTRDPFDPVRRRLQQSIGMIRQLDASYLCYALLDAIIDNFFPVIETYGDRLEALEECALSYPNEKTLNQIYTVRRELLALRRVIWPQREIFNTLIRDGHPLVTPQVVNFYRDCYDHTIQIIDVIETYRELGSSLMDVYLSGMSNKMNEI
ncbi:MAG: magnesium/cobalt transporter CorA, partial [Microcystaceae cyanobacterium]